MQRITLDNFRVFGSEATFDLAPVTVLTGKNNSGKSSLIKAFLVLADYLEQDDQTVLRLDGPRASRHRISDWTNLKNWNSPDSKNLILSYTQGEMHFSFEFKHSGTNVNATASLPPCLYRFQIDIPGIDQMTLKSIGAGISYQLEVSQKFIDYVAGSAEEKARFRETEKHKQQLASLQQQQADLNLLFHKAGDKMEAPAYFPRLISERQHIASNIANLEDLLAQGQFGAGIFFQAEVFSDSMPTRPTISSLIQIALNDYIENHEEQFESEDEDEEDDIFSEPASLPAYSIDLDEIDEEDEKEALEFARNRRKEQIEHTGIQAAYQFSREQERRMLFQFRQVIETSMRPVMRHLGANRTYQARLYLTGTHHAEINTIAESFQRQGVFFDGQAEGFLCYWLREFEIGQYVTVELVDNSAIRIQINNEDKMTNLADLGFGAGQILAILLQIASLIQLQESGGVEARNVADIDPTLVLIEEPEANLHPRLQSLLAKLFTETAHKYKFQFILETHSEYLIRKLQLLVATQQCSGQEVALYYLDENSQRHIQILPDGKLSEDFGTGFFDEADERAMELFRHQKKAARTQNVPSSL